MDQLDIIQGLTAWICFNIITNQKYHTGGEVIGLLVEAILLEHQDIQYSKKKEKRPSEATMRGINKMIENLRNFNG